MAYTKRGNFNDIKNIPFDTLYAICKKVPAPEGELTAKKFRQAKQEYYTEACSEFAKTHNLKAAVNWLPAQLLSIFGKWKPVLLGNTLDPEQTLNSALLSASDWERGVYFFAMYCTRSAYLDVQYKSPNNQYCSLVPLILCGFKKYQNIAYSNWNSENLHLLVEPKLYDAITCTVPENLSSTELLEIREAGLVFKTGKKAGLSRDPASTFMLYGVSDSLIGHLPWLAQVMLTQIWCAHPDSRHSYMILDPSNWDNMPKPLIEQALWNEV